MCVSSRLPDWYDHDTLNVRHPHNSTLWLNGILVNSEVSIYLSIHPSVYLPLYASSGGSVSERISLIPRLSTYTQEPGNEAMRASDQNPEDPGSTPDWVLLFFSLSAQCHLSWVLCIAFKKVASSSNHIHSWATYIVSQKMVENCTRHNSVIHNVLFPGTSLRHNSVTPHTLMFVSVPDNTRCHRMFYTPVYWQLNDDSTMVYVDLFQAVSVLALKLT